VRRTEDDHYAVLGVARGAAPAEIRRAYRLLALRHHPDRAGPDGTAVFQRITVAYGVLSDPALRAAYDARNGAGPAPATAAAAAARARAAAAATPAAPPVIERLAGPLDVLVARAAARLGEDGVIELLLTEREARGGGTAAITLPWRVPCPTCGGCAQPSSVWCVRCEFEGTVREDVTVCIVLPPAVTDGATFSVRVDPEEVAPPVRVRARR
jgi:DnaJ-class molecular chaperone